MSVLTINNLVVTPTHPDIFKTINFNFPAIYFDKHKFSKSFPLV